MSLYKLKYVENNTLAAARAKNTVWGNNYPDKRHFTPKVTLFKPRFDYIIAL